MAIAFADLAGYTRLTEEAGEEQALDAVERFVAGGRGHAARRGARDQDDRRRGDGRRLRTPRALVDWAVGFQRARRRRAAAAADRHPLAARSLYRDGDYYGRAVNLAARVAARAAGGEVLVTRPVMDAAGPHLRFDQIGEVTLKGFNEPTELFAAGQAP